jgi:tetraacyldisaccharide 4'-kinase
MPAAARGLLFPLSLAYGWITRARVAAYQRGWLKQHRLKGPVISVGNLTVGGTGKTPMVLWLAERFLSAGKRVAILSRGYKGTAGSSDEVRMLKERLGERVVFGVGADRFQEGQRIEAQQSIDVFLLDDGFQHLQLARDIDVVMLDGSRPLEHEALLPIGTLREPVAAWQRADLLVVTRKRERLDLQGAETRPLFYAETRLLGFREIGQAGMAGCSSEIPVRPLLGFCGIGNPEGFYADLERWNVPLAGRVSFPDHHRYSDGDLAKLTREAARAGAQALVTTEKDEQNLPKGRDPLKLPVYVAVMQLALSAESAFSAALDRLLDRKRGAAA